MAALHVGRHREMVAGGALPPHAVPDVVDITCPVCGVVYIADLTSGADPPDLEMQCWAAEQHLADLCPEHEHRCVLV
jgi:hypothetical protein